MASYKRCRKNVLQHILDFKAGETLVVNFSKKVELKDALRALYLELDDLYNFSCSNFVNEASKHFTGDTRTVVVTELHGYDEFGRLKVFDGEKQAIRLIDPRTVNYIIWMGDKYIVRK